MDSISLAAGLHAIVPRPEAVSTVHGRSLPCSSSFFRAPAASASSSVRRTQFSKSRRLDAFSFASNGSTSSVPTREGIYTVGDFMTGKEHLHAVKPTTTIDEALDILVEKRITGFPVIDDDWKLVLPPERKSINFWLDTGFNTIGKVRERMRNDSGGNISGGGQQEIPIFPDVDSSWKTFNEIQKLLSKTNGKVISDVMTPAPLVVRENTNLEDVVRILLVTKFRRLPVVDGEGRLVGIITRGNIVRAALQIKQAGDQL
ncbi:CBS domain-containing protein CBSX1, chloroplastic-like isoform X1 [Salvia hispanica]|uniref:CBS domain-containing protein CBSX1, chloroplastic-like isoform X1 n=1 Tax=Salvia hispanica TaxID=49212 RepID=UPI0020093391|nr:CBS domain-containing protein CBSX1, chloroplastic-like isoform X1 [Salvia hispanica]